MPTGPSALKSERRKAINAAGLEPSAGFLHEFPSGYQTKQSPVYDLQEPFRWLADVTVMDALESGVLDLPDFYFTGDDYRYRFNPEAKERFVDLLRERFNSGVMYRGRWLRWDTVIEQKAGELGRFLAGKSSTTDFAEPAPALKTQDTRELRDRILTLTQSEARKLDIGRSTLHNLRRNALRARYLRVYKPIREKLLRI